MNLYELLDCTIDATEEELRLSYKKKAMEHHPDRGGDEELFKQIKLAYEVLSDAEKRAKYDATGSLDDVMKAPYDPAIDLFNIFVSVLQQYSSYADTTDLIKLCIQQISRLKRDTENKIAVINNRREEFKKTIARISRKEGNNTLALMLEAQIESLNSSERKALDTLEKQKALAEYASSYEYNYEQPQPATTSNYTPFGLFHAATNTTSTSL